MSLITRQGKGSLLSIEEMDNNLLYLDTKLSGATNGLSVANNNSELGGVLTKNTLIELDRNEFKLENDYYNLGFEYSVGINNVIYDIKIQYDGKILLGGIFTQCSGETYNGIVRLNSDYTIDNTFIVGVGFTGSVRKIIVQDDGKILCGGGFTEYSGMTRNCIIRLNSDGSVDNTFNIGSGFADTLYGYGAYVTEIFVQNDGKILVGGYYDQYSGQTASAIIRLNSDGTIDDTFVSGTGFVENTIYYYSEINYIYVQDNGKITIGGLFDTYNSVTAGYIIRLNSGGTVDSVFGDGFNSAVYDGDFSQDSGKFTYVGGFTTFDGSTANGIIRLNTDDSVGDTFDTGTGFDYFGGIAAIYGITSQNDGKLICVGDMENYNDIFCLGLARINSDGSLDESLNIGTSFNSHTLVAIAQDDGSLLVAGYPVTYNGTAINRMVKLNSDGSINDTTEILSSSLEIDGNNIILSGETTKVNSELEVINGIENYAYLGDKNTDNSWRMGVSGTTMIFQIRSGGTWITKGNFT